MYLFRLSTLYRVHTFYVLVQLLTIGQERIAHPVKERKEEFGIPSCRHSVFVQTIALAEMCTNCKMFSQMQIAIALRLQHINQKYDTLVHTRFFHFSFNKLACWWIILFLHLRLFAWSRIIILPVWIQGDDILIGGKHLSTFVGALSTLFTENVRLSRVIFKLCCHIFSSSLTHFITTYIMLPLKPWWNFLDVP